MRRSILLLVTLSAGLLAGADGAQPSHAPSVSPADIFEIEYASDPRIAPDGKALVYVRNGFDVETDRPLSTLWIVRTDGSDHRAVTSGRRTDHSPRWSPDGRRLLFVSVVDGSSQLHLRYMDTGETAVISRLRSAPRQVAWSPDGEWIAFVMNVPADEPAGVAVVAPPPGADWGPPWKRIEAVPYRIDGAGYLKPGYDHLFVIPATGGSPRQLTSGPYDHADPDWLPEGRALVLSANRRPDREHEPVDTDLYEIGLAGGAVRALTDRYGPDDSPAVSPDGRYIAYTGFDDRHVGYQVSRLHVLDRKTGTRRALLPTFDRSVTRPTWSADSQTVFVKYDSEGTTRVAAVSLTGRMVERASGLGDSSFSRPYASGGFSVGPDGAVAFTLSTPRRPADIALAERDRADVRLLTRLNEDLLGHRRLGDVQELSVAAADARTIQGWYVTPPAFDAARKYPMILEIHGGPHLNYGPRFAAEAQLYAAAGYVVLYLNPRGSTSYGEEFAGLIHRAFPGPDYDDLMRGVDALLGRGFIDANRLYVTGASGGGTLTAWITSRTNRFRAAVAENPVINWYSFVLHSDWSSYYYRYWFPGPPWEHAEHYLQRSPLHHVGRVDTPTLLITGDADHRTPISETEQYFAALRIRRVPTAMIRVPGATHIIAGRPSDLIAKVAHVLDWFDKHSPSRDESRP